MQAPKEPKKSSKTNTYNILQQLTGLAPQPQLLVVGHDHGNNLWYTFVKSSFLFALTFD
jgi:hypothetical protein